MWADGYGNGQFGSHSDVSRCGVDELDGGTDRRARVASRSVSAFSPLTIPSSHSPPHPSALALGASHPSHSSLSSLASTVSLLSHLSPLLVRLALPLLAPCTSFDSVSSLSPLTDLLRLRLTFHTLLRTPRQYRRFTMHSSRIRSCMVRKDGTGGCSTLNAVTPHLNWLPAHFSVSLPCPLQLLSSHPP